MPEFDHTQIPPELIAELEDVDESAHSRYPDMPLEQARLFDVFDELLELPFHILWDKAITYEDGERTITLKPVALSDFGILFAYSENTGTKRHVILAASLFVPGVDDAAKNQIDSNKNQIKSFVFGSKKTYRDFIEIGDITDAIYSYSVCDQSYTLYLPAYVDGEEIENAPVDTLRGYGPIQAGLSFKSVNLTTGNDMQVVVTENYFTSRHRIHSIKVQEDSGSMTPLEDYSM